MTYELSVREEILQTSHRWPVVYLFCLAGIVVGWGVSLFWPTSYRAAKEIYVGINPYRALDDRSASDYAEVKFTNPDDYKNWQMANLNAIIQMDWLLQKTLVQLRLDDTYWENVTLEELGEMLYVNWRNAGKWHLVAESDERQRAAQAVTAWHNIVIDELQAATLEAQDALIYDKQVQEISANQIDMELQISELRQFLGELNAWEKVYLQPAGKHQIDERARRELDFLTARKENGWLWISQFEPLFPQSSEPQAYREWLGLLRNAAEIELQSISSQLNFLVEQHQQINMQYKQASQNSYGISGNMVIEEIREKSIEQYAVRPAGLIILVGGFIGLLLWIVYWLITITL